MASSRPPSGHFTLLYFAAAASYAKKDWEHLEAPLRLSDLFNVLERRHPGIREQVLQSCAVTINLEYVDVVVVEPNVNGRGPERPQEDQIIGEGDEVAIIPPVSSG
ncbi:MAG: hypothetical protein M1815_006218 [Lichina confinis]|nr:MAG: hypothetical protein M1815_006218 [Lichina confinis]